MHMVAHAPKTHKSRAPPQGCHSTKVLFSTMSKSLMTPPVVTTMSFIGWCDQASMKQGVVEHANAVRTEFLANERAGVMDRYEDAAVDGKRKNESNTRTIVRTGLRWKGHGIQKVYRQRPYMNKARNLKSNFRNCLMVLTGAERDPERDPDQEPQRDPDQEPETERDTKPSANLFTNGKITSAGHQSAAGFNDFGDIVVGGLFPGATLDRSRTTCTLMHTEAQLAAAHATGIDMERFRDALASRFHRDAKVSDNLTKGCIVAQFTAAKGEHRGPSIHLYPNGRVQVVVKTVKDNDRMWELVRTKVIACMLLQQQ